MSDTDNFRRIAAVASGQFVGTAAIDGVRRFYTFRHVGDLPLILSAAVSVGEIYAAWWHKALVIGPILAMLCAATIALCLLFRREMVRRMVAETALVQAAERLSVMAATDGLTGLANRRQFDANLNKEWRRAIRSEHILSLLLLDADHFKSYNDSYGHQQGDEVLKSIARPGAFARPCAVPRTQVPATAGRNSRCCCQRRNLQAQPS